MTMDVFDDTPCALGEGPLWHPERGQLFWFDIIGKTLLTRERGRPRTWRFDGHVSAAGWVSRDVLLIAGEAALFTLDLATGAEARVCPLEADDPRTRSNDGRADPWGGFWIGTMAKSGETAPGAIYRWYRGDLRRLYPDVAIPNAICFAPDRSCAYFADTRKGKIWRQPLAAADGWPEGDPALFLDATPDGLHPDGAVVDAEGCLWNAQWGAARVARYAPDGRLLSTLGLPTAHTTCPALGGPDLRTLYVTTARQDLTPKDLAAQPQAGMTFATPVDVAGQPEPRVIL